MSQHYQKHPLEELTEKQLEELSQETQLIPMKEENRKNIKQLFEEKKVPRKKMGISPMKIRLIAAAMVLLLVGFTQSDVVREAYQALFGDTEDRLVEEDTNITGSTTDQGLTLSAVSAFKDGETTYFVATLKDEEGYLLSENMRIGDWEMNDFSSSEITAYDERSKTATIVTSSMGNGENAARYQLNMLLIDRYTVEKTITNYDLTVVLEKENNFMELNPNEGTHISINQDKAESAGINSNNLQAALVPSSEDKLIYPEENIVLSAIGYRDGLLHVQIEQESIPENVALSVSLENKKTDEFVTETYSIRMDDGDTNNDSGMDQTGIEEFVFSIDQSEIENYALHLSGERYRKVIRGNWAIDLGEVSPIRTKTTKETVVVNYQDEQWEIDKVEVSPIGATIQLNKDLNQVDLGDIKIQAIRKDGAEVEYETAEAYREGEGKTRIRMQGQYIDLSEIESIKFNGTVVPVS